MVAGRSEKRPLDADTIIFEDVKVTKSNAPRFILDGGEVNIWSEPYSHYHTKTPTEYIRETITELDKKDADPFPDIVGKSKEKELVKTALFTGSPILFKGERGYGKTTFSKAIAKLLPEKLLAMKDCKVSDDPTRPTCFSCKEKMLYEDEVELAWVPRIWVRIPGDPLLTTRQLVGGISIQKIREGYDLDHPEVFIPGRILKANRGLGYFDELGAVPTSLQTLLHELFEEHQVTTSEGDIVPFKTSTVEIASTNPANYRGTSPIKEPLLDRMEEVEIGPPETLEEEIEIGKRNMHHVKTLHKDPKMPEWHLRIMTRTVRFGRDERECPVAKKLRSPPSCRATIKLLDHVKSRALRNGREVPLLADYGDEYEMVELALGGRIEVEYGTKESKSQIVKELFFEAMRRTCKEIYDKIPAESFEAFYNDVLDCATQHNGEKYLTIDTNSIGKLKSRKFIESVTQKIINDGADDETFLSVFEMAIQSISVCFPRLATRKDYGYVLKEIPQNEAGVRNL